ncbi:glycosyltransferase [Flammeovirga sp. SubArs3]|uniref:glycosyltransferase n=1 Tax=Flammeovirga sp. SubArs3 TaxID=2995316 RepID=UPI00248B7627|nr:glycosyltransferase [Flammeovirga sp. SubArs3]
MIKILSISTTQGIPVFKKIINALSKSNKNIELCEMFFGKNNKYYDDIKNLQIDHYYNFEDYNAFRKQTTLIKFYKYLYIIFKFIFSSFQNDKHIYYTPDFQILSVLFFMSELGFSRKSKFVYHQFEVIEEKKLDYVSILLLKYFKKKVKKTDLFIFPEKNRKCLFYKKMLLTEAPFYILPNTCDVKEMKQNKALVLNDIPQDVTIVAHVGRLGGGNDYLPEFLIAIKKMFELNENFHFLFIGNSTKEIEEFLLNYKGKNVTVTGFINHSELDAYYRRIDIGLVLYKNTSENFEYCAPNKLYEFWSYGIPVLGHQLTGLVDVYKDKENLGELIKMDDNIQFCKGFRKLNEISHNDVQKMFKLNFSFNLFEQGLIDNINKLL